MFTMQKFRTMKQDGMGFYIGRYWRCITPVCSKKLNHKILRKNLPKPKTFLLSPSSGFFPLFEHRGWVRLA